MLAMLLMVMMVKVISMRMELTISNDPKEDNQGTEWLNRTTENTGRVVRRRPAWLSSTTSMETVSSFSPRFSSLSSPPFAFLKLWMICLQPPFDQPLFLLQITLKSKDELMVRRNQMARRGVPPREANHMRRRTRASEVKKRSPFRNMYRIILMFSQTPVLSSFILFF